MNCELEDKIFHIEQTGFDSVALELFRFQVRNNHVYREFINALGIDGETVQSIYSIPFMPIQLFKSQIIKTTAFEAAAIFESSGTSNIINSRHFVKDLDIYRRSFRSGFQLFYGPVSEWCMIGLLPSYLERQHSSLVMMVDDLIHSSGHPESGFYLCEYDKLKNLLQYLEKSQQKTLLMGVTFALLDFAENFHFPMQHTLVMETGGMKGRRQELTRDEVHGQLKNAWGLSTVHSEYGMTELLSQAYSKGEGIFYCPPWMKVFIREEDDPLCIKNHPPSAGVINVIDLANIYSCAFIATDDIGKLYPDGSFEVLGRMDSSDIRGCSLMLSEPALNR